MLTPHDRQRLTDLRLRSQNATLSPEERWELTQLLVRSLQGPQPSPIRATRHPQREG